MTAHPSEQRRCNFANPLEPLQARPGSVRLGACGWAPTESAEVALHVLAAVSHDHCLDHHRAGPGRVARVRPASRAPLDLAKMTAANRRGSAAES
jgi:hypothetical protein